MKKEKSSSDVVKAYQETCNIIKHYSNASYNVRVLVVVQGFVLLSAWILNFQKASPKLLFAISLFGILLTILLFAFHHGYFYATNFFYRLASEMEEKLFSVEFRPFSIYNAEHNRKYKSLLSKIFILYAPFTLTTLFFLVAFALTVTKGKIGIV